MSGKMNFASKKQQGHYIASEIRKMKRLWENKPNMAGLLKRREEEAQLI